MDNSRRKFIVNSAVIAAASPSIIMEEGQGKKNNQFIHHVFFYLKNNNKANRDKLIAGLKKLSRVKTIKAYHVGVPAPAERGVIVSDYSISWTTFFANVEAEKKYQVDPIHLQFIEECQDLWEKVVVYDTEAVIF
ncbi:MAG TPA: Dabb family protein [Saprospiraceae bacterium]|nr:Dabb family protein [Saprospiraceae bacterium]